MAAYGALVSLSHILDQILHPPPAHHFIFVREQIESLQIRVLSLLDFLENYYSSKLSSKEMEDLESRIVDASYAAEDVIESNLRNQICAKSTEENLVSVVMEENREIHMMIQKFLSIEKDLVDKNEGMDNQSTRKASSSPVPLRIGKNTMVGFEDHLIQIMGALSTDESDRRIIPIVGMGGIGKTNLATNVFNNPFIIEKFDIRAWFVVSQECTGKEILLGLLHQIINTTNRNELEMNDDDELGEKLHKTLFGRKYFIVMDDMWDITAWEIVKRFLPDNNNGSRILVTTRLLKLAVDLGSCTPYELNLLDEAQSWDLLREKVFPEGRCPVELEEIGRNIARKCRGLPLALVVIGGLLAKSKTEDWKYVEEDVTSAVNNEDDELCMKVISLSYSHLPIYLKPCFLYLAVFPQDFDIKMSRLVRLWVAEGFVRQRWPKSLEEIGEEYLNDLIDRNLILVSKRGISGEVKTCHIHDLLSDLCRREAQKDNFLVLSKLDNNKASLDMQRIRRLSINNGQWKDATLTASIRSFLTFFSMNLSTYSARRSPLLRVLDVVDRYPKDEILQLINSRYVSCTGLISMSSSSILSRLWCLQTLVVSGDLTLPIVIWQMPQLRHVQARRISLPDPPSRGEKITVLENLQTLSIVKDFKCTKEVTKRIPNLKKLGIVCPTIGSYSLSNLGFLHKLESLSLAFVGTRDRGPRGNMVFPSSLKKLVLSECKIPWEDMSIVGSLPNLEVLKLRSNAAVGQKWISNEGEFTRLKYLLIHECELEIWESDNTHFPCLEQIHLGTVSLKQIPSDFAEILPLQVIDLYRCKNSLLASVKEVSEERENLGYDALQIQSSVFALLRISVQRGINLAARNHPKRNPYAVVRMSKQILKTRVVRETVNPEWHEDLTVAVLDPSQPVSVRVYDRDMFSVDEKIGDAEFDIRPFVQALKMHPNALPNGTITTRILPSSSNCLSEESFIFWKDGNLMQDMCLGLRNIESGQVKLQLRWIDIPGYEEF
ncbi:hypothetical protein ABFX02_04G135600 [Erythranthe guttata]